MNPHIACCCGDGGGPTDFADVCCGGPAPEYGYKINPDGTPANDLVLTASSEVNIVADGYYGLSNRPNTTNVSGSHSGTNQVPLDCDASLDLVAQKEISSVPLPPPDDDELQIWGLRITAFGRASIDSRSSQYKTMRLEVRSRASGANNPVGYDRSLGFDASYDFSVTPPVLTVTPVGSRSSSFETTTVTATAEPIFDTNGFVIGLRGEFTSQTNISVTFGNPPLTETLTATHSGRGEVLATNWYPCPPGALLQPPGPTGLVPPSLVPPSDPAVQRLLDQQARGGGCRGCNE